VQGLESHCRLSGRGPSDRPIAFSPPSERLDKGSIPGTRIQSTSGHVAYVCIGSCLGLEVTVIGSKMSETKYHAKMRAFARRCWTVGNFERKAWLWLLKLSMVPTTSGFWWSGRRRTAIRRLGGAMVRESGPLISSSKLFIHLILAFRCLRNPG
jgi:hypothetical protein